MLSKERIKEKNRKYRETHREQIKEYHREWEKTHPEALKRYRAQDRKFYYDHKEQCHKRDRKFYHEHPEYNRKYYQDHKEQILEREKRFRQNHLEQLKEYSRRYHQRPEVKKHRRDREREYNRKHVLRSTKLNNGKFICGLNKRPYPEHCELCGKPMIRRLAYHHWNNSDPSLGIWCCWKCHGLVEAIDEFPDIQKIINYYLNFKEVLEKGIIIEEKKS